MPPFVVSLGDPAGVGPEVVAKAWQARQARDLPPFIAVGDMASIRRVWDGPVAQVDDLAAGAAAFADALPVWHIEDSGALEPGVPTLAGAHCALRSLELCVGLARSGEAAGVITAPVCKDQLYQVGFTQSGQTEFVADRCGVARSNAVMMLAGPGLRVVPVTIHIPFAKVVEQLTEDLIVARGIGTARGLAKAFGIDRPRMAVAALNPHGGENGALGNEETNIIAPAIARLQAECIDAFGPVSPDALFAPHLRPTYDVALCMYHDQALIPLKALHFDEGVNVTLGLPIIRTSPDHGTAFNIAGKGVASPEPMIAAIAVARDIARVRAAAAGA